jgi:hypothetical protein
MLNHRLLLIVAYRSIKLIKELKQLNVLFLKETKKIFFFDKKKQTFTKMKNKSTNKKIY